MELNFEFLNILKSIFKVDFNFCEIVYYEKSLFFGYEFFVKVDNRFFCFRTLKEETDQIFNCEEFYLHDNKKFEDYENPFKMKRSEDSYYFYHKINTNIIKHCNSVSYFSNIVKTFEGENIFKSKIFGILSTLDQ